ncbi:MAG TPA: hypothetical protein ENN96_00860 [Candidatus Acetothermia bacterium]|nr:hypothetical protein [Candidatus Acetothermia bacterium]
MKKLCLIVLWIGLGATLALAQHQYAFYYDLTDGQDLEITVMNPMVGSASFVLSAYDAYGMRLWSDSSALAPSSSGYILLSEVVPLTNVSWGLVTVSSTQRLLFGLEYLLDGQVVSISTLTTEVTPFAADEPFWLGAYYSQAGDARTAAIVMNPWSESTECLFQIYNRDGYAIYSRSLQLAPYEAEYLDLTGALGAGALIWGLVDIAMQVHPVILALEYYGRGCNGLVIDNVIAPYY